jgi:hypothetical protein
MGAQRRLAATVPVKNGPRNEAGDLTGDTVFLPIGSVLPAWASDGRVGEHALAPLEADAEDDGDDDGPKRPHGNANAETWRAYATGIGIEVPSDATRKAIIALVDAHEAGTSPTGDSGGDDSGDGDSQGDE